MKSSDEIAKLLPCPFCGGRPVYESRMVVFHPKLRFRCEGCGIKTAWKFDLSEICKHWDKRTGK